MKKQSMTIVVIVTACFVFVIPFLLEFLVFRNDISSVLSNAEWAGFFGSFIGGILGGTGTLLAVYFTTKETRNIQKNMSEQIEGDRALISRRERKRFADEVAEIISKYIADISLYVYGCRTLKSLYNNKNNAKEELNIIEGELRHFIKSVEKSDNTYYNDVKMNTLKNKENKVKLKIQSIENEITLNKVNRSVSIECYFLLQMKLMYIKEGDTIIKQLKFIHEKSVSIADIEDNWIEKETIELQDITVQFVRQYVEQKPI